MKFITARPSVRRSLLYQAISRQVWAFLATLAMTALSVYLLNTYSINQAARYRSNDAVRFYTARIGELEQLWLEEAVRYKARLEFMRILEDPQTRWTKLAAYLATQSTDVTFSLVVICDPNDKVLFKTGHGAENLPAVIDPESFSNWYMDQNGSELYRTYRQSIGLGPDGTGSLILFRPVGNYLLHQNAFPDVLLFLTCRGRVVSSSSGEQEIAQVKPDFEGSFYRGGKRYEQRALKWKQKESDSPVLIIQNLIRNPFSFGEVLIASFLIISVLAFSLWYAFGLWMVQTTQRILLLGRFCRKFMKDYGLMPTLQHLIEASCIKRNDEINEVALSLQEMARAVVQRDEAREEKEQILVESTKKIREITSTLTEGLFVLDRNRLITFMNPEAERLLGWSEAEVLGKHGHMLFHEKRPDSEAPLPYDQCLVYLTLQTGKRQHIDEDWFVSRNGGFLPVSIIASPIIRDDEVCGAVVAFHDISERKRVARALRESEEQYRLLLENIGAIAFKGYIDWSIDFFDNRIESLSGYSKQEFESRQIKWSDLLFPQDIEPAKQEFLGAVRKLKPSYVREYKLRHKDGRTIWVHERSHVVFDERGRARWVNGLFFDITERKKVEEALAFERQQLLSIFDSITEPVFVCDPKSYDLLFINEATKALFGDVTGQKCFEALQNMDSPCPFCSEKSALIDLPDQMICTREMQNRKNQRWYRATERTIRWPDGRMVRCEIALDINDLKLAELELRRAHEELELRVAERTADLHAANKKLQMEILEREKAQTVLRESEERFRLLFENAKGSIFWIETETGNVLACNKSAEALVEKPTEEIIGHSIGALHPADPGRFYENLLKDMDEEGFENVEAQVITRAGKIKDVQICASVTPVGGRPIIQTTFRDITELKRAEQQLKESEQYLGTILDTMHVGVVIIDPKSHIIVDANRHAAKMIGTQRSEMLGHECHNFICPAQKGKCPVSDMGIEIDNSERVIRTVDGTLVPILKSVSEIVKGERTYLVESFIDISDLKLLLKEQELDIALAKNILNLTNGRFPRYLDLNGQIGLSACAISLPCHREGGDHYFLCQAPLNGSEKIARTLFSLKDQSGHKVGCVLRSILTDLLHHAVIKAKSADSLQDIVSRLNAKICEHRFFKDIDFVTAVDGEIDNETLMLRYALSGHSNFLVISGKNVFSLPRKSSSAKNLPLGIFKDAAYGADQFQLGPGDKIILYTDGLAEANRCGPSSEDESPFTRLDVRAIAQDIVDGQEGTLAVLDTMERIVASISAGSRKPIDPQLGTNETMDDITLVGIEVESRKDYPKETWRVKNIYELQNRINEFYARHKSMWIERGYENPIRLRYALNEAVLNAWKHGNRCNPEKTITIFHRYCSDFVLEVIDEGTGFDISAISDPRYGECLYRQGGRGILLIKRYSTSARWDKENARLVMTFDRHPQPSYLSLDSVEESIGL